MTIYSGFSHWKWWFSIVMLVYQRVTLVQDVDRVLGSTSLLKILCPGLVVNFRGQQRCPFVRNQQLGWHHFFAIKQTTSGNSSICQPADEKRTTMMHAAYDLITIIPDWKCADVSPKLAIMIMMTLWSLYLVRYSPFYGGQVVSISPLEICKCC